MCQSTASCSCNRDAHWLGSAGFSPPDQFRLPAALWLQPDTIPNLLSLRAQLRSAEAARLAGGTSKGWSVPVMLPCEQASIHLGPVMCGSGPVWHWQNPKFKADSQVLPAADFPLQPLSMAPHEHWLQPYPIILAPPGSFSPSSATPFGSLSSRHIYHLLVFSF